MIEKSKLKYLSITILEELRSNAKINQELYISSDFDELELKNGWSIELNTIDVDHKKLTLLDGSEATAEADFDNSKIVYSALKGMTPALARDERIWTHLTHIECLDYCRNRWLKGKTGDALDKAIQHHMFARTLNQTRDDNAIARLWWNMYIATIADPADPEGALKLILKTADIRSNFIERSQTFSRRPLARALIRIMRNDPWITSSAKNFRTLMKVLNRDGGGMLFETFEDELTDQLLRSCTEKAKIKLDSPVS